MSVTNNIFQCADENVNIFKNPATPAQAEKDAIVFMNEHAVGGCALELDPSRPSGNRPFPPDKATLRWWGGSVPVYCNGHWQTRPYSFGVSELYCAGPALD